MLGINEMGYPMERIEEKYRDVVENLQPVISITIKKINGILILTQTSHIKNCLKTLKNKGKLAF